MSSIGPHESIVEMKTLFGLFGSIVTPDQPPCESVGAMLAQVRLRDEERRKIGVAALYIQGRAERNRYRARLLLDQNGLRASNGLGRRRAARRLPRRLPSAPC